MSEGLQASFSRNNGLEPAAFGKLALPLELWLCEPWPIATFVFARCGAVVGRPAMRFRRVTAELAERAVRQTDARKGSPMFGSWRQNLAACTTSICEIHKRHPR